MMILKLERKDFTQNTDNDIMIIKENIMHQGDLNCLFPHSISKESLQFNLNKIDKIKTKNKQFLQFFKTF